MSEQKRRSVFIAIGVGLLVLGAIASGAFVRWAILQFQKPPETTSQLPADVLKTQDLLLSGKTEEAENFVNETLANPSTSNDDKYFLYIQQGNIEAEKGEYQATIDSYLKAAAIKETYQITSKLGAFYQQIGDNQKAIEYYKRTIELIPPDLPVRESEINIYNQLIQMLSGE